MLAPVLVTTAVEAEKVNVPPSEDCVYSWRGLDRVVLAILLRKGDLAYGQRLVLSRRLIGG